MALVNVSSIFVKNPNDFFLTPFSFTVVVETLKQVSKPIEFKFIYIGSPKTDKFDQVLDTFEVGPLPPGVGQFDCEINAPDPTKIPADDLLGVTALMAIATFKGKEFFRVGYYIYNSVPELETTDGMPVEISKIDIRKVQRSILSDKPKIIHYPINWEEQEKEMELLSEIMGGTQDPSNLNQDFLGFSDNSINFAGIFNKGTGGTKGQSTDLFAKPSQTSFGVSNQFSSFGSGLFSNNTDNSGSRNLNDNAMLNSNNQGGFSLFTNNAQQMQMNQFQQPFGSQTFGTMGLQQQMLPMQQTELNGYYGMQNSGFGVGIGQQPFSQGVGGAFPGFGQNYQ